MKQILLGSGEGDASPGSSGFLVFDRLYCPSFFQQVGNPFPPFRSIVTYRDLLWEWPILLKRQANKSVRNFSFLGIIKVKQFYPLNVSSHYYLLSS